MCTVETPAVSHFHPKADSLTQGMAFLHDKPALRWGILLTLFLAGFAVRVSNFEAFQVGDRQFRSALLARAYYFKAADSIPEWRRQVAEISQQRAGVLEPPIMELLVSRIYRFANGEHLWIPGLLASVFWVIGGALLYKVAQRIVSVDAGVFAVAYYLFVPIGVHISRGFVPDPLMIALFALSIFTIIRYYDQSSTLRLVTAAVVSGLAVLVKPFCLFPILGAFISLAICKEAGWKRIINLRFITFLGITFLPLVYYSYGIFAGGSLSRQAETSFLPRLLLTRSYWQGWLLTATAVVGFTPLIAALIGLPLLPKGLSRTLLIGLGLGYIVFCLSFSYHIRFGPHYHSQLIIIVALSSGPLLTLITNYLRQLSNEWYWWLPVPGALLLVVLFNVREIKGILPNSSPSLENVAVARKIGEIVSHSTRVVYVAPLYGMPLEYYGELAGSYWPRGTSDRDQALGIPRVQSVEERLNSIGFTPEYFVITHFQEYEAQHPDLREFLLNHCRLVVQSDDYLIYDIEACTQAFVHPGG